MHDIERFSKYDMILEKLNYLLVILSFLTVFSLTARSMKNSYRDCSFLCSFQPCVKANKTQSAFYTYHSVQFLDYLFDWLTQDSTHIGIMVAFFGLLGVGIYGCILAQIVLPVTEYHTNKFICS